MYTHQGERQHQLGQRVRLSLKVFECDQVTSAPQIHTLRLLCCAWLLMSTLNRPNWKRAKRRGGKGEGGEKGGGEDEGEHIKNENEQQEQACCQSLRMMLNLYLLIHQQFLPTLHRLGPHSCIRLARRGAARLQCL